MIRLPDTTWLVDDIVVDGLQGSTPTVQRGQTTTLSLRFDSRRSIATEPVRDRYHRLLQYIAFANEDALTYGTANGIPYYREDLSSRWTVDSLVVPVEPGRDVVDAHGVWALVLGGSDESTPLPGGRDVREVSLDVFVLAARDEYEDRSALEADLGTEVVDGV